MEKKPIPEVGKTYRCFDDGKIARSRMYDVLVTRVIPIKDVSDSIFDMWQMARDKHEFQFHEDTDYIIESVSYEQDFPKICLFARTGRGKWFGLGEYTRDGRLGNLWCCGILDVDGELYKRMLETEKEE